jgi:3'-phosphoadenosine 5'-phosphosulfate sulfotransferase (PAPS reductase)/FAD synthetase
MHRENETIQPVYFQKEMGGEYFEVLPQDKPEFHSTRRKFPAVGADLNTRWCSWIAKISVMQKAINHSEKYTNANIVIMTGERRDESTARAKYHEIEKYRSFTKARRAISWRPIIDWTEKQVWEAIERWKVQPHPCYELGWGRCSCQLCIFSSENTWASLQEINPDKVKRIDEIEKDFNFTLYAEKKIKENKKVVGTLKGIYETKVNRGKSFVPPEKKERWLKEAQGEFVSPIFVKKWVAPIGAFNGETSGAT